MFLKQPKSTISCRGCCCSLNINIVVSCNLIYSISIHFFSLDTVRMERFLELVSQPLNLATLLFQLSSSGMCDSVFCLLPLLAHTVKNFHILCSVEFLASPLFLFFSGAIITCQDCGQPCPGAQRVTMKMERVLHVITSKYILLSLKQCKYIYKECL